MTGETTVTAPWYALYTPGVEPHLGAPDQSTLALFGQTLDADPSASAVHYFGRTLSRAELAELAQRIAGVLRRDGVGRGDRVAISLQNTPVFPAALLAVWGIGAYVVPINPMLRPDELTPMLTDSGAAVLIAHPAMQDVVSTVRERLDRPLLTLWSDPADLAGDLALPFPVSLALADGERSLLAECAAAVDGEFDWSRPNPTTSR